MHATLLSTFGTCSPHLTLCVIYPQVVRFSVWDKDPTESEMIGQVRIP
jgi:hypothetical protein